MTRTPLQETDWEDTAPEGLLAGPASALEESMVAALNAEVIARRDVAGLVDAAYTRMSSPMGSSSSSSPTGACSASGSTPRSSPPCSPRSPG